MKTIFPASYSTLCSIALASMITERYGLANVVCKFLTRGVGDTYLIQHKDGKSILRIYRSSHRNHAQITEEVLLLLELEKAKVSVSYPLADLHGEHIQPIQAIEGLRHAVLFTYADGNVVNPLNDKQLLSFGTEMAKFHNVSSKVAIGNSRWNFDIETTLIAPLKLLQPKFEEDHESFQWLSDTVGHAKEKLQAMDASTFSTGYCHYDFLPKNFHFRHNAVTFFYFDFMGTGWLVNDVMTYWQHLNLDVYTKRTSKEAADQSFNTFLNAYRQYRPLSDHELAAIPYLAIGFWLFYMGFHTTHDQFIPYSQPAHLKSYVNIMRYIKQHYF